LAGLVRRQVLTSAADLGLPFDEVAAGPEALATADAVFITNSLIGVRPADQPATVKGEKIVRALAEAVEAVRRSCR
jgi:branched-chain amino acid aminotransferase/4-amino-4-deoxychorismate lyase